MSKLYGCKGKFLVLFLALLFSIYGFSVFAQEGGGTLRVVLRGDIKTLDPAHMLDSQSSRVGGQIYENLATYNKEGEIVPRLATSWEFSEDGKKVTFFLREGVQFTDGTKFDASVVKYNYDRIMDPEVACYNRDFHAKGIESVEVVDKYTVRFHLASRNAAFIANHIITDETQIISPKSVEEYGYEDTGINGSGTGPFKFVEYKEARHVKLVRNENYWGDVPKLEGLTFKPIPERQSAVVELRTGGVDLLLGITKESLKTLSEEKDIVISKSPNPSIRGLWFQVKNFKPFSNLNVRKAFLYGLPKDMVVKSFLEGIAIPLDTLVPVKSWAYDPDVPTYGYDVEKAKTLLEQEGWKDEDNDGIREKNGKELKFTVTSPDGRYLADKQICEAAAHSWSEIGAKVEIEVLEWGAWMSKIFGPEKTHDMVFMGWLQRALDPTLFMDDLAMTGNVGNVHNYSNPTLDAILEKASKIANQDIRKGLYYAAEQILYDEAMWIPLYNALGIAAYNDNLKEYQYSPYYPLDLNDAYFEG